MYKDLQHNYYVTCIFLKLINKQNMTWINKSIETHSNKNCLWWPCLLTDWDEMNNLYRRPSIDASYQVSVHLVQRFQRRRLKCEKLMDYGNMAATGDSCFWLADLLNSSPLKSFCQMNRNLIGSIYGRSSIVIAHFVPIH
jgi:hypothetical protein